MVNPIYGLRRGFGAMANGACGFSTNVNNVYQVLKPYYTAREAWKKALAYTLAIVLLIFISGQINVEISHATNFWMNAIGGKEIASQHTLVGWLASWPAWLQFSVKSCWLIVLLFLLALITPVQAFNNRLQAMMGIDWRGYQALSFFTDYFARFSWLKLESYPGLDSPDQRMTDNTRDFTATTVVIFVALVTTIINVIIWTPVLMHIDGGLTIAVYVWALVVSAGSIWIGKKMVAYNQAFNEREASLRFALQEARREAESIASSRTEHLKLAEATARLQAVLSAQKSIANRNFLVQLFTTPANGIVPWLAPLFIAGIFAANNGANFGTIMEAGIAVTNLYGALSVVVVQFPLITAYLAYVNRLRALQLALKKE